MSSTITAGNATNGLALSCDNTGILELKTGTGSGTTAITADASQNVTFAGTITATNGITGDLKFNSGYGSVAVGYGCRAWVNFNGTGTVAIRASGNVSSITDNGVGDYTVNFTNALSDANYSVASQFEWANTSFGASGRVSTILSLVAGSFRMRVGFLSSTALFNAEDVSTVCTSVFR